MIKYFNLIEKYFSYLEKSKINKLHRLYNIYKNLNSKINLISRKDFENFYLHHIIHSLSLAIFIQGNNNRIIDLGTGGGLPGIPLSIILDKNEFLLVDSKQKKINAVEKIIVELSLSNVKLINSRIENLSIKSNYIVCRGVSSIKNIIEWSKTCIKEDGIILLLKGGNVEKELININHKIEIIDLENIYSEEYFKKKKIIKISKKCF